MTRRSDRRAACPRARTPTAAGPASLRGEVRALRLRIEGLWSAVLLGEELALRDVHAIAVALSDLRRRIEVAPTGPSDAAVADVVAARDDVACCVVAVADLVVHYTAA